MKRLVCVFAHPDDEAFGPSGTIHLLTKTHDVYIICVTNGDAGKNSLKHSTLPLGKIRQAEMKASSKLLGTKKVFFLNYADGSLNNLQYHDIAEKIQKITDKLKPELLLTFEQGGVSGHLDHIAVSMITSYIFHRTTFAKKIMYYCISREHSKRFGDYFIYRPDGYEPENIHEVIDISKVRELKNKAMKMHKSQIHDSDRLLKLFGTETKEFFLIKKKG